VAEVICPSSFNNVSSISGFPRVGITCPVNDIPLKITWNPDDKDPDVILYNDLLSLETNSNGKFSVRTTKSKSSGKWYWEVKIDQNQEQVTGIGNSSASLGNYPGLDINGYGYARFAKKCHNGCTGYGSTYAENDIIGIALDLDVGKIWFSKNNVWQESGDPAAETGEAFSGISGTFFPMHGIYGISDRATARFNAADQSYDPPAGFSSLELQSPLFAEASLSVGDICAFNVDLALPFSTESSLNNIILQQQTPSVGALSTVGSGQSNIQVEISGRALQAVAVFSSDHCFNYAQIDAEVPTSTCAMSAVFRYASIDADVPTPAASFTIGKKIVGSSPVLEFTCTAYSGRNPSIIASASCPTCSMRIGFSFSGDVSVPICTIVADTHHLVTIYGRVPVPTITCVGDTENITVISVTVPTPTGLFEVTVGNVASILGRSSCPYCTMVALTGQVVALSGRVPAPGALVRFYASLVNDTIILAGTVPTPTMTSNIDCFTSSILRHVRGKIR